MNHEYPRPTMVRSSFVSLNGSWKYVEGYHCPVSYPEEGKEIQVPFAPETRKSGIGMMPKEGIMTYGRKVVLHPKRGKRLLLHFEGVDYLASLYINGTFVKEHLGAYSRFTSDITSYLHDGDNEIVLSCYDPASRLQVRGKQRWEDHVYGCFYHTTSGIFKSVWIEETPSTYIDSLSLRTTDKKLTASFRIGGNLLLGMQLVLTLIDREGNEIKNRSFDISSSYPVCEMPVKNAILWDTEHPYLYSLEISLVKDGKVIDSVGSRCGFRLLERKGNRMLLNGKELFLKMVLDQGYFPDSGLTAPSYEALKKDTSLIKEMGFNGVRKHQKIEDERFYSLCDEMGLLCWLEMPSQYTYSKDTQEIFKRQWIEILRQNDNHPSIMAYVPFNESWGLNDRELIRRKDIQSFVNEVVKTTKEYDETRFVISNDGWEHTKSDLLTLHIYEQDAKKFHDAFPFEKCITENELCDRNPYCPGYHYHGEPILFTEFGGASFRKDLKEDAWGYGTSVETEADFLQRFRSLVYTLTSLDYCRGYCYTQLTDVEQEVNGLLSMDRTPKINLFEIRKIVENGGKQ